MRHEAESAETSRVDVILGQVLPGVEARLASVFGGRFARGISEFLVFGIKQAWACLFGGLMVAALLLTGWFWPEGSPASRYDFLVIYAVSIQIIFLLTKLERPAEAVVILIFHVVGTAMEVFKTEAGSWTYPEESFLRIGAVPLFSGFMYAAVGSYLARVMRVLDFSFDRYPPRLATLVLAALIYGNFFAHHYLPDIRWGLMAATGLLFLRTNVHYRVWRWERRMPLLLGFALVVLFIFIAENAATYAGTWLYPDQEDGWRPVSWQKWPAWFLLMILSWVLVTLVHRPRARGVA